MNEISHATCTNMKRSSQNLSVLLALSLLSIALPSLRAADALPPGRIAFQGFLTESGAPVGNVNPVNRTVVFRIYRNAAGTAPADIVWTEQQTLVVDQGHYTTLLGNGVAVGAEPFTNNLSGIFIGLDASQRFLGITPQGQPEIKPRIQFFASPFAQYSRAAGMLVSGTGTPFVTVVGTNVGVNLAGAPTASLDVGGTLKAASFTGSGVQLSGVTVTAARITGTITAAQIADGTLTSSKIATSAVDTAQLADASVTSDKLSASAVAAMAAQIGGVGSGAIIVSTNANNTTLTTLGFVNVGPATLDGETYTVKAFVGAPNAPGVRFAIYGSGESQARQSAWTGSKWIIWGGTTAGVTANYGDGRIFDPALGTWSVMSSVNAPSARREIQTAWTGTKYLVWGGIGAAIFGDGKIYDPATDTWTAMSNTGAPSARTRFVSIWTGTEWIIWGGFAGTGTEKNDGAIYNPATDTWRPMAASPLAARIDHSAVWTGTEIIIQGGWDPSSSTYFDDGARYNPATDTWTPMPFSPLGKAAYQGAVWTGTEMIIYGGSNPGNVHGGARYNPVSNTWKSISPGIAVFQARYRPLVAWTGVEMIIWGGGNLATGLPDGVRYNPATDTWVPLANGNNFIAAGSNLHDIFYTWTGSEFMWMGFWNDGGNNAVYSYRPPRAAYLYAKP